MNHISRITFSLLLSAVCGVGDMSALTVTATPGALSDAVGNAAGATELIVKGAIDAGDFDFISERMTALQSLDLGDAVIAAYSGAPTAAGRTSSPANTLPECALMLPRLRNIVLPESLTAISDGAFGGAGIVSVVIPGGVRSIGTSAFAECKSLASVVVPSAVSELGHGVFRGCDAMVSASVNAAVDAIPAEMFMGCGKLSEVKLPASVRSIGADAFNGCVSLENVTFPSALVSIGDRAFYGTGICEANFAGGNQLSSIGNWAFADCRELASVKFSDSLASIGKGAFYNDASLALEAFPRNAGKVSDFALRGVGAADGKLLAGTAVDSIGAYALAGWTRVQKLVLPESLEYIGDGAMANWTALDSIIAEAPLSVPALGADVWRGVNQADVKLLVPSALHSEYSAAPQWRDFDVVTKDLSTRTEIVVSVSGDDDITARLKGMTLEIEASEPISDVTLFDLQGRAYQFPFNREGTSASVDTSAWNSRVMIVRVLLSDGTAGAIKLSR